MSCILRVSGDLLDVQALLRGVSMSPYRVWTKGQGRGKRIEKISKTSGAAFVASAAGLRDFDQQVRDAALFLQSNMASIRAMRSFSGVDELTLDFGIALRDTVTHSDLLPATFLKVAAESNVDLLLSHYPCSEEEEREPVAAGQPGTDDHPLASAC